MNDEIQVVTYEKLVSDNIPQIIDSEPGGWYEALEVTGAELTEVVKDKLLEEVEEVTSASDKATQIKELSTLILLLSKFKEVVAITDNELTLATEQLVAKGKTFEKNIFLVKATLPKGMVVNSVKQLYVLTTQTEAGETKTYPLSSVTDRAAIRKAKEILQQSPTETFVRLIKNLEV